MDEVSGIQAVAWGLLDGGIEIITAYPGFHAHELASLLGIQVFSVNEKNSLALAWGASLAGVRSVSIFKNLGLNDAADPFINICTLGVHAGMVLVVLDDIDVQQSQILQDSRPYADFPCSLWLEPCSLQDAYDLARQAPQLSEQLKTLVVLRLTNLLTMESSQLIRQKPEKARLNWCRKPEHWVVHPVNGKLQRRNLEERQGKVYDWIEELYSQPNFSPGAVVNIIVGMVDRDVDLDHEIVLKAYPLPRRWLASLAASSANFVVKEHGLPYLADKLAAGIGAQRVQTVPLKNNHEGSYRITDKYEALYAILRSVQNRFIVGDLGGHTLDPLRTIDSCLCYGCSVGVATGIAIAEPTLNVICVTGDAAFLHTGKTAFAETIDRQVPVSVIVLMNGGSVSTGGQILPGECQYDSTRLEQYEMDFPLFCNDNNMRFLLNRPIRPRLIRLKTKF
ncbi:MAG: thiamine pyrophosphate-dependent enzyme [Zavarzinella sp.]